MSESTMATTVRRALAGWDPVRVENRVGPGTPDVEYLLGWLELKWLRVWPENADESPVLIKHYTPQQRVWHRRRWAAGGMVHLLLQVGREWMLYNGESAAKYVGVSTRSVLVDQSDWYNGQTLRKEGLRNCLLYVARQRMDSLR